MIGCRGTLSTPLAMETGTAGHYIRGVPFYRQGNSTCGPAALAGVMAFWGKPVARTRIEAAVYLPELQGTLPMDLEAFARKAGFDTNSLSGTLVELRNEIRRNVPVICLLDLGFWVYRKPHYVTVIGFDDERKTVIMHDGLKRNSVMDYETFGKAWERAGRWMIVLTPKSGVR